MTVVVMKGQWEVFIGGGQLSYAVSIPATVLFHRMSPEN